MLKKSIRTLISIALIGAVCVTTCIAKERKQDSSIDQNRTSYSQKLNINSNELTKKTVMSELQLYKFIDKENHVSVNNKNSLVKKYLDTLDSLSKKKPDELKSLGYTPERIKTLQMSEEIANNNKFASSKMLKAAEGTITIQTHLGGYYHDMQYDATNKKAKTLVLVQYEWKWSNAPIVQNTDCFGLGFQNNLQISSVELGANYYNNFDGSLDNFQDYPQNVKISPNKKSFYGTYPVSIGKKFKKKTALSGYAFVTLVNLNSYVDQCDFSAIYIHSNDVNKPIPTITNNNLSYKGNAQIKNIKEHFDIKNFDPNQES